MTLVSQRINGSEHAVCLPLFAFAIINPVRFLRHNPLPGSHGLVQNLFTMGDKQGPLKSTRKKTGEIRFPKSGRHHDHRFTVLFFPRILLFFQRSYLHFARLQHLTRFIGRPRFAHLFRFTMIFRSKHQIQLFFLCPCIYQIRMLPMVLLIRSFVFRCRLLINRNSIFMVKQRHIRFRRLFVYRKCRR